MNEKTEWQQGENNGDISELMYIWNVFGISLEHHRTNQVNNATYGIVKGKINLFLYVKWSTTEGLTNSFSVWKGYENKII